jgi:pimeloyl-ACP methyl ester carboxylesterase
VNGPADGWLERAGVGLHFLEWRPESDTGAGPTLLLHGLSSNAHYWDRLATHLDDRRLVALDQRGHGLTGRPPRVPPVPAGFAMDELIEDVALVVERLDLGRPVVAGHSWGATVALELAARRPDLVSAIAFIDGPIQSASNLFSWEEAQKFMQPPLPRYTSFAQAVDDVRRDFDGAWAEDLEPFVMSRLVQEGSSFVLTITSEARLQLLRGLYDSPVDQLWAQLESPALALLARGGPSPMTDWREKGARQLERSAPDVQVMWFDTPHDIPIFAPEAVAAEIRSLAAKGAAAGPNSETAAGKQLQD